MSSYGHNTGYGIQSSGYQGAPSTGYGAPMRLEDFSGQRPTQSPPVFLPQSSFHGSTMPGMDNTQMMHTSTRAPSTRAPSPARSAGSPKGKQGQGKSPKKSPGKSPKKSPGKSPGKSPKKSPGKGNNLSELSTATVGDKKPTLFWVFAAIIVITMCVMGAFLIFIPALSLILSGIPLIVASFIPVQAKKQKITLLAIGIVNLLIAIPLHLLVALYAIGYVLGVLIVTIEIVYLVVHLGMAYWYFFIVFSTAPKRPPPARRSAPSPSPPRQTMMYLEPASAEDRI